MIDVRGRETPSYRSANAVTQPYPPKNRAARKTVWPATVALAALLSGCGSGSAATSDGITLKLTRRGRRWLVSRTLWY